MKRFSLLAGILSVVAFHLYAQDSVKYIPIETVKGYGPFMPGFAMMGNQSFSEVAEWKSTDKKLTGVPKKWKNIVKKIIWFDLYQFAYQNYYEGNLKKETFLSVIQGIDTINRSYSKRPIKCFVYVIFSRENGKLIYKIDSDNDLDFDDEHEIVPPLFDPEKIDSLAFTATEVSAQRFINGKVEDIKVPVLLVYHSGYDKLMWNIPQYGQGIFKDGNRDLQVAIVSDEFSSTAFSMTAMLAYDAHNLKKYEFNAFIKQNQNITLNSVVYKNLGFDHKTQSLKLEKITRDTTQLLYSSAKGGMAKEFSGNDFISGKQIDLTKLKGKFVFLDFWGTWCSPCIQELPNLKKAFSALDSSRFAMIGIVANADTLLLKKAVDKHKITWPQIISEETNPIIEQYDIQGYPTTFLIGPDGMILGVNLRGKDLKEQILQFMNQEKSD